MYIVLVHFQCLFCYLEREQMLIQKTFNILDQCNLYAICHVCVRHSIIAFYIIHNMCLGGFTYMNPRVFVILECSCLL